MMRLIRNYNVNGASDIDSIDYDDSIDMVPIEKLRELLPQIRQLRKCMTTA